MAPLIVATFNANSIRVRLPQILDWLERVQPDVLGVQETKAQDADFPRDALAEAGWHAVFRGEKSYNGVALITREPAEEVQFGFDDGSDPTRLVRAVVRGIQVINSPPHAAGSDPLDGGPECGPRAHRYP